MCFWCTDIIALFLSNFCNISYSRNGSVCHRHTRWAFVQFRSEATTWMVCFSIEWCYAITARFSSLMIVFPINTGMDLQDLISLGTVILFASTASSCQILSCDLKAKMCVFSFCFILFCWIFWTVTSCKCIDMFVIFKFWVCLLGFFKFGCFHCCFFRQRFQIPN